MALGVMGVIFFKCWILKESMTSTVALIFLSMASIVGEKPFLQLCLALLFQVAI
jgi:hypothetical protein